MSMLRPLFMRLVQTEWLARKQDVFYGMIGKEVVRCIRNTTTFPKSMRVNVAKHKLKHPR